MQRRRALSVILQKCHQSEVKAHTQWQEKLALPKTVLHSIRKNLLKCSHNKGSTHIQVSRKNKPHIRDLALNEGLHLSSVLFHFPLCKTLESQTHDAIVWLYNLMKAHICWVIFCASLLARPEGNAKTWRGCQKVYIIGQTAYTASRNKKRILQAW